mgnify:CR=1 FL=1
MFTLEVENKRGQKLKLTQDESNYQISNIDGLKPPSAEIYTDVVALLDGEKYKSSHIEMRNVVLTVAIKGDVERNRTNLYKYFSMGKYCKLHYTNTNRDVYCEGYVETIENDLFANSQTVQISIVCPDPYLYELETIYTDMRGVLNNFEFPFAIDENGKEISSLIDTRDILVMNGGETETGMIITIYNKGSNSDIPKLYNSETGEKIEVKTELHAGEKIIINTNRSKKSVSVYRSNGTIENVIGYLTHDSSWLQLDVGANYFTLMNRNGEYDSNLVCIIEHSNRYLGV